MSDEHHQHSSSSSRRRRRRRRRNLQLIVGVAAGTLALAAVGAAMTSGGAQDAPHLATRNRFKPLPTAPGPLLPQIVTKGSSLPNYAPATTPRTSAPTTTNVTPTTKVAPTGSTSPGGTAAATDAQLDADYRAGFDGECQWIWHLSLDAKMYDPDSPSSAIPVDACLGQIAVGTRNSGNPHDALLEGQADAISAADSLTFSVLCWHGLARHGFQRCWDSTKPTATVAPPPPGG